MRVLGDVDVTGTGGGEAYVWEVSDTHRLGGVAVGQFLASHAAASYSASENVRLSNNSSRATGMLVVRPPHSSGSSNCPARITAPLHRHRTTDGQLRTGTDAPAEPTIGDGPGVGHLHGPVAPHYIEDDAAVGGVIGCVGASLGPPCPGQHQLDRVPRAAGPRRRPSSRHSQ